MAKLVETFQRLQKIETACMPKDDPAPVYLLDEILEIARSSPEQAQAVADSVEKKLASRSPIVKFKALRIIKHLCTKGCSTFQRCMQKHSGAVRELVHFRGEPDPFKGDVPNARVREFAKEVLEVLFNANPVATTSGPAAGTLAAQGRIQGFGSDGPGAGPSYSGGYGGGGGGSGGGSGMGALSSAAASLEGPLAAGVATVTSAINDFLGGSGTRAGLSGSRYGGGSPTRNGGGGGYGGFEPMAGGGGGGGGYGASAAHGGGGGGGRVTASQVLGSEDALVDDICTPGGLRPAPDAADLRRFVEASSAMDGLRLAELLRAKMEGAGGWQVALRALCALDAVLKQGSSQAAGEVAVMFQSEPAPLQALATSPQALVRDAAARCLRQLLGDDAVPAAPAAGDAGGGAAAAAGGKKVAKSYAPAAPAADLLSLDDDGPAAAPAAAALPAAAPAAAAGPASALDLLGDLAGPAPAPASAAAPRAASGGAGSLFSGLDVGAAPAAPAAPAAAVGDMFGGLSLSPPQAAPALPAAAAPAAAGAPLLDDLFSGLGGPQQPAPQPQLHQPQQPQHPQHQQHPQGWHAAPQGAVQMQALGGLGAPMGGAGALGAGLPGSPMKGAHAQGRGLSGGGAAGGGSGSGAAQQPWSGGLTKNMAAFDFVMDEFGKK